MQPIPEVAPVSEDRAFPLDGVLERNRIGPGLTIAVGLILGFVAFQGISLVVLVAVLAATGQLTEMAGMDTSTLVATFASEFLIANTVGQFLGLLGLGWLFARLHTSRPAAMLRLRGSGLAITLLSLAGLVALFPIVQWAGSIMDGLPWPEGIREFEQMQMDLIEQVLATNLGFFFTLFTMAITPALCEELFFRGYIQRQAERMFSGWLAAIIFSGVVFGLYHFRITQALPLSMLGVYMAYVVWRSNSLVPGILVHLANNGFAVALGAWISSSDGMSLEDIETMDVPIYIVLGAVVVFGLIVRTMHRMGRAEEGA
ncbi:MAG: CPBP family intramembrane metalloprotease [Rhodothermales bacterium]|nr:CPBP family intramembrane metalloprotease [Rhodothermales bacterium]MBO6780578.1 CPBP family intramembrane metalloprotease [Rhodothermales bacterium]